MNLILSLLAISIVLIIVASIGIYVFIYNSLVKLKNLVDEGWSGVDVQLKRRYDLIPNLVETVKGYTKHEKGVLEEIVNLRNSALNANTPAEQIKVEKEFSTAFRSLFALAENYPDLKASANFAKLQGELAVIEEALQNARRYYNATVRDMNTRVQIFPSSIVANIHGFKAREFFEVDESEKANVKVEF